MIKEIKERISCVQYAQMLGWQIKKAGDRTFSLEKGSNATCLVIQEDFFYDFKLCLGGDVIDLCSIVNHNGDKGQAIKELAEIAQVKPSKDYTKWVDYTQNLNNQIAKWHSELRPKDYEYLHKRRLNDEYIKTMRLGWNGQRIIIPYYKNKYVAYWIGRGENPKYFKPKLDGYNENIVWGQHTLARNQETLVVTEGAFDAMSFDQEGFSVIATMGGHFSRAQLKIVIDICKQFKEIFLAFDSDDAGNQFLMDFAKVLFTNKINFTCTQLITKDVSDYYASGGDLKALEKIDGLKFLCSKIEKKEDFKNFIKSISRFTGRAELAELFDLVKDKEGFNKTWLAEIKKQAMSAPTEDLIAKEIIKKHLLKYNPKLGFYEYEKGKWNPVTDDHIRNYISDELGNFATGGRGHNICNLIKAKTVSDEIFNYRPVFNFINGVLELETGEFKEHNPLYLSTLQVNYPYTPNTFSANWTQFLDGVCNSDKDRMKLLQEIAGYVLFNDNSLQKCFFLIGHGANGKSVFLDILTELYGHEAISSVEMSSLTEAFQRINIMNSILNISTETNTNVKGAESYFKQAVVGDMINGCYKGMDFISFRPRCKFITACNEYIQSKDITEGFERRILFIKFPIKFCDNPVYENEKQVDKNITKKLYKELPAIFNWAYEGYKNLKQAGEFTITEDQNEMITEFRESTNSIYVFMQENEIDSFLSTFKAKDIYNNYVTWCKHSGRMVKSSTSFARDLKSTVETFFKHKFRHKKDKTGRFYEIVKFD